MMVTVPHIAVASYPDALPFIYGIRHAPDFRVGELLAATPERCAELFAERETDLALVPPKQSKPFPSTKPTSP